MKNCKSAFTMIELVFVIVILGILAAVSIPKFAAVRTDASAAVIDTKLSNCIDLAGKSYLEDGHFDFGNEVSCNYVVNTKGCFSVDGNDSEGVLTVKHVANATSECLAAQSLSEKMPFHPQLVFSTDFNLK